MTECEVIKGPCFGVRHLQTLLLFLGISISLCERLNVSVSLVAMTNAASTNLEFHEFDWDERQRSYIISAFYWGYVLTQLPAGYFATKMGVKLMMLLSILCCTICTLIIPLCLDLGGGWQIYCAIRFIQGLAQGFLFPLVHAHLATWSPCEELTRLGGFVHIGVEFGTICAMCLSGFIAGSSLGWPGNFYVFGGIGLLFCLLWALFAEESPSRSKTINIVEKEYIIKSQAKARDAQTTRVPVPWRAIFTSVPFISLTICGTCELWGMATMQAYIPPYMHGILKMNINSNGLYSTLPFLANLIIASIFTVLGDIILKKHWVSLAVFRKTVNSIGMFTPAVILVAIGFLNESQTTLALVLIILNVGFNAGYTVGALLNVIDLSPNHAGVLMGILNGICNLAPIFSPLVNGRVLDDETNRGQWQIVFFITAALFFVGNLQFIFLGSTKIQKWNDEHFLQSQDAERIKTKTPSGIEMNPTETKTSSYTNKCFE